MTRNRPQTEKRIVEAACGLIADGGFSELGVNLIAARAGIDKVLIYRYFGGVDGLLEHIGHHVSLYPEARLLIGQNFPEFIEAYRLAMAENRLAAVLLDWVRLTDNPLTMSFRRQRRAFWDEVRDQMQPSPALNVVLDLMAVLPLNSFSAETLAPLLDKLEAES